MINITRDEAVRLFIALGSKTADKWGRKQMTEKIYKIDEMIDTKIKIPPDIKPLLNSVLIAIENKEVITLTKNRIELVTPVSNEQETIAETYSVYVHPESDSVFVAPDNSIDDGLTQAVIDKLSKKEAEEQKKVIEKKYLEKNAKSNIEQGIELEPPQGVQIKKPDSVRILKSRSYCAGVVIRKHGISAGITEAMVNEVDKMHKKRNRQESMYRLRLAWHAIYGFCGLETR
jgi:hypothetical protein